MTTAAASMGAVAVDAGPFDLAPQSRSGARAAVLCVHGLTGTPFDLRPVGEALVRRGLRARAIVLPGHERGPEALVHTSAEQWLAAVGEGLSALRREHERVFCVGLSLGGLLTLAHAAEGHCDAIAVIATPLHFPPWMRWAVPVMKRWQPMRPKEGGSDICDPEARACNPGFEVMPLAAVEQLMWLQRQVVERLSAVTVPTLVAHGARDRTANPDDAREIAGAIGSRRIELLMLERSAHVATVDYDGARLAHAIARFFESELLAKAESDA